MLSSIKLYKLSFLTILLIFVCGGCAKPTSTTFHPPVTGISQELTESLDESKNVSEDISTTLPEPTKTVPSSTNIPLPTNTLAPTTTPSPSPTAIPTETPIPTPTLIPDNLPPTIEGVNNKVLMVGETVSYKKGVTVSDNTDENPTLTIDSSKVDLNTPGTYPVVYLASDCYGNTSMVEITVTVNAIDDKEIKVKRMAADVISSIITEDMSKWDTCYTLWNWCRLNIRYVNSSGDRSSIYTGAYEGFRDHKGDCYTFYATFAVLLNECGIDNLEVRRVGGKTNHWWNLVNLGDGWYHCDSSPRKAGHTYLCFMQTDAQVQEYTEFYKTKPNYYVFDESLLPERATEIVFDGNLN